MGHCIHAIIADVATADDISRKWVQLPRLNCENGFCIFPVDGELIDHRIAPHETPTSTGDEFMLLTSGFRDLLRSLSVGGQLAYCETEYFGGVGGQGALVCRDGEEIMPPRWGESGAINAALKLIGITRGWLADEFTVARLDGFRCNDDILERIARQQP